MAPGPSYIAPTTSFFFNTGSNRSLIDFLPSKKAADRLLQQYWYTVHSIAMAVHRPSFEKRYETFWNEVQMGLEPVGSLQAVVFAALFSGAVSMSEDVILREFGASKRSLEDNFQQGTETALARANILRTTKVETLQAFVMYMVSLIFPLSHATPIYLTFFSTSYSSTFLASKSNITTDTALSRSNVSCTLSSLWNCYSSCGMHGSS